MKTKIFSFAFFTLFLLLGGCDDDKKQDETVKLSNFTYSDCKNTLDNAKTKSVLDYNEYFEYEADGNSLKIKHINAEFNCCPEEMIADFSIEGSEIKITEHEKVSACKCICPYDLAYTIAPLTSRQKYTLILCRGKIPNEQERTRFTFTFSENLKEKFKIGEIE